MSFNLIIPEMPDYISGLGGEDYKGYIIGVFTIAAALSRPLSGKLADRIGRIPVMVFGGLVCVVISFLYPVFATVLGFIMLRLFHGLSTGFMPTGTVAYLADIIPSDRRGEAMGLLGVMNNVGFMAGNALSSKLTNAIGIQNVFYVAGILAIISVAVVFRMKETVEQKEKFNFKSFIIKWEDVWDNRTLRPAIVMVLTITMFGTLLTIIPDYSKHLGIDNKGLFLSIMTVSTIVTRVFTSKLSDKIGRAKSCIGGTAFWVISAALLSVVNINTFYLAGITCGIASGINSPAIFVWAVDVANGVRTGRAMATLFLSLEVGISFGAFGSAKIYSNVKENLPTLFLALMAINIVALVYVVWVRNRPVITTV